MVTNLTEWNGRAVRTAVCTVSRLAVRAGRAAAMMKNKKSKKPMRVPMILPIVSLVLSERGERFGGVGEVEGEGGGVDGVEGVGGKAEGEVEDKGAKG